MAITCAHCGAVIAEDESLLNNYRVIRHFGLRSNGREIVDTGERYYVTADNEFICESCYDEDFSMCEDCGVIDHRNDMYYMGGADRIVCEHCSQDYGECECCHELYHEDDLTGTIYDGDVCRSCYDSDYYTCADCERAVAVSDTCHDENGETFCQTCYEERYTTCVECGGELDRDDACETHDGDMCWDCVTEHGLQHCDRCGVWVPPDEHVEMPDGSGQCSYCFERTLREAGASTREELVAAAEEQQRAWRERERCTAPATRILRYHANTARCFLCQDDETTQAYFGIELEVECAHVDLYSHSRDAVAAEVLKALNQSSDGEPRNHWTAMNDGSLSCGFELISQPMTARYFDEEVAPVFKNVLKDMTSMGLRSHDTSTCGLHFHVSRKALSTDTMVNMKIAADKFSNVVLDISRRKESSLERWARIERTAQGFCNVNKGVWDDRYESEKRYLANAGRYLTLNFTNTETVEFRACRGTLRYSSFIGCLHFFRFLIDWAESHTFVEILEQVTEEDFARDMAAYSPELRAYAIERGVISETMLGDNDKNADAIAA